MLRRAWRAYWSSRPRPVRKMQLSLEIHSLREQGLSSAEIIQRIEGR